MDATTSSCTSPHAPTIRTRFIVEIPFGQSLADSRTRSPRTSTSRRTSPVPTRSFFVRAFTPASSAKLPLGEVPPL